MDVRSSRVLIVDDIAENLLALEGLLRTDNLEVLKADGGTAALELLLQNDFALAIVDVQMPQMDGFELARLMRGTERTKRTPIIFLTAGGVDEQRRFQGYGAGAVDFLFKPFDPLILLSKVGVFIELHHQRQDLERQRDQLAEAAQTNARLLGEIRELNNSLERRVQERTTQLMDANEQLQGFTHSVAHDFRQHIRSIGYHAALLQESIPADAGERRTSVERIRAVSSQMGQMTDDLLQTVRLRNESLRMTRVDLSQLATEASRSRKDIYPDSECIIEEGLSATGDRTMLRIVMDNLIDNAFKYSQYASSPLVEFRRCDGVFFVRDNGVGFDMNHSNKLFAPFERLHHQDEFAGTGIGLANVKRIIDRHGGRVWAESTPGQGTSIFFTLE